MTSQTTLHRRPIRGFLWGLMFGLGVSGLLIVFSIVPLSISNLIIYTLAVTAVSTLWGLFAPPKKPKGPAPAGSTEPASPSAPPTSPTSEDHSLGLPPVADSPMADASGEGDETPDDEGETAG